MSFEDKIKKAQETKNQSSQTKRTSTSTRQTIKLGKGISACYASKKIERITNEDRFKDDTTDELFND